MSRLLAMCNFLLTISQHIPFLWEPQAFKLRPPLNQVFSLSISSLRYSWIVFSIGCTFLMKLTKSLNPHPLSTKFFSLSLYFLQYWWCFSKQVVEVNVGKIAHELYSIGKQVGSSVAMALTLTLYKKNQNEPSWLAMYYPIHNK